MSLPTALLCSTVLAGCTPTPQLDKIVGDKNTVGERAMSVIKELNALPADGVHFSVVEDTEAQCDTELIPSLEAQINNHA